jgi:hypothetical protein
MTLHELKSNQSDFCIFHDFTDSRESQPDAGRIKVKTMNLSFPPLVRALSVGTAMVVGGIFGPPIRGVVSVFSRSPFTLNSPCCHG